MILGRIIVLIVRHWLTTWLHFGLGIGKSVTIFGIIRDGGWIVMTFVCFFRRVYQARDPLKTWHDNVLGFIRFVGKEGWIALCILVFFTLYAVVRTGFAMPGLLLVGFKSLILPFVLIISGVILGLCVPISTKTIRWGLGLLAIGSILFGSVKIFFPSFMQSLGYGPVGDWVANQAPPVYYRTGSGGIPRFAGAFAGPNALMYVLVFFFPLLGLFIHQTWHKIMVLGLAGIMGIATIARGFLVGISVWFVSRVFSHTSRVIRWILIGCITVAVAIVGWMSVSDVKYGSTVERVQKWREAIVLIAQRPWIGYGLGMSGPGYFWGGLVVPENVYFQVILDIGVLGFLGWLIMRFVCIFFVKRHVSYDMWIRRCVGLMSLAAVGLVLHPIEDATVNMLIFGIGTWMIVGGQQNQYHIV